MRQKLFIFLGLILLVLVLVGLNAASYTQKEKTPDSEIDPNRSTYNSGATGTQALYSLLAETGRKVIRWQEPPATLATVRDKPAVFVVIGSVRRQFDDAEIEQLLKWVATGGRLVVIDRRPPTELATTTANWAISFDETTQFELLSTDPSDQAQMTHGTPAVKPAQPTLLTHSVNAIQPSRFASAIRIERFADGGQGSGAIAPPPPSKAKPTPYYEDDEDSDEPPPPPPRTIAKPVDIEAVPSPSQFAPVVHFVAGDKDLLVEAPYGEGKIVYLSDPYIVSNAGISLVDNAQLAINMVASRDGTVAFDEYHQGYGANNNAFLKFFEGTPVVAIFFQALVLVGLVFYSQSRRFARPVPEPEPDRLSKLEYVSAMASAERSRAYDLAIENIYTDFRRRTARLLGADNFLTKYDELARLIAERAGLDARKVSETLFKCEDIIRGEPTSKREVVALIAEIRQFEQKLGLTRTARKTAR